jgi:Na+/phosphate symporter
MSKELSKALLELTKKTLELTKMNNALITYLIDKKKKAARKDVESKHAIKQLEKQTTATF